MRTMRPFASFEGHSEVPHEQLFCPIKLGVLIVQGDVGFGVVGPWDGPTVGDHVVNYRFAGVELVSPEVDRVAEAPRDGEVA